MPQATSRPTIAIEPPPLAEPTHEACAQRLQALGQIARGLEAERERLAAYADVIAREFWRAEAQYRRAHANKPFKYTPRVMVRAWAVTLGWQRKSSTIYGGKRGQSGEVGPRWKYLPRNRRKRYPMTQFRARGTSAQELAAIAEAERHFGLIRGQCDLLVETGRRIKLEATRLGGDLGDSLTPPDDDT
jgi:hypothetical protein